MLLHNYVNKHTIDTVIYAYVYIKTVLMNITVNRLANVKVGILDEHDDILPCGTTSEYVPPNTWEYIRCKHTGSAIAIEGYFMMTVCEVEVYSCNIHENGCK